MLCIHRTDFQNNLGIHRSLTTKIWMDHRDPRSISARLKQAVGEERKDLLALQRRANGDTYFGSYPIQPGLCMAWTTWDNGERGNAHIYCGDPARPADMAHALETARFVIGEIASSRGERTPKHLSAETRWYMLNDPDEVVHVLLSNSPYTTWVKEVEPVVVEQITSAVACVIHSYFLPALVAHMGNDTKARK